MAMQTGEGELLVLDNFAVSWEQLKRRPGDARDTYLLDANCIYCS